MSLAEYTVEISPSIFRSSRPALCLPDDPSRVLGYQEETTPLEDRQRLSGQGSRHLPTTLNFFSDVTVIDGVIYKDLARMVVANRYDRRAFVRGDPIELDRAMLCTNPVIDRYFGHWLLDGRLLEILAEQQGIEPLAISGLHWMHEPGYRDMIGHVTNRPTYAKIKELVIADDRGINECWQRRGVVLRERVRNSLPVIAADPGPPVFVRRGASGADRDLVNEGELMDFLARCGFIIIEPEAMEPKDVALALARAPLIVLVEGSAQIHALVAAKADATIICIMPPRRMNAFGKVQADGLGVGWAYTVADDRPGGAFHQPLDRIARIIDLAA